MTNFGRVTRTKANELVLKSNKDDLRPDLFFFIMPKEIETVAEKFELLKPLLDEMTSYASCTGMSNHAVLVCRKSGR